MAPPIIPTSILRSDITTERKHGQDYVSWAMCEVGSCETFNDMFQSASVLRGVTEPPRPVASRYSRKCKDFPFVLTLQTGYNNSPV